MSRMIIIFNVLNVSDSLLGIVIALYFISLKEHSLHRPIMHFVSDCEAADSSQNDLH